MKTTTNNNRPLPETKIIPADSGWIVVDRFGQSGDAHQTHASAEYTASTPGHKRIKWALEAQRLAELLASVEVAS